MFGLDFFIIFEPVYVLYLNDVFFEDEVFRGATYKKLPLLDNAKFNGIIFLLFLRKIKEINIK